MKQIMKEKRTSDVHDALANDLTQVFFKLMRENPHTATKEIMKMVPMQKAPRFYVSFETTRRHLSCIKKGTPVWERNANKKKLYAEIYKRWKALDNGTNFKNNSYKGLIDIILSPAPCFYIDYETAKGIIYKNLRRK